jgi:hypothetical protein
MQTSNALFGLAKREEALSPVTYTTTQNDLKPHGKTDFPVIAANLVSPAYLNNI